MNDLLKLATGAVAALGLFFGGQAAVSEIANSPSSSWSCFETEDESHTEVAYCESNWGTLWLTPEGEFAFALQKNGGEFIYDESQVPSGWR